MIETATAGGLPQAELLTARIDRFPPSKPVWRIVATLAMGAWFEIYGMFLTGYVGPGLVKAHIFTGNSKALYDLHSIGAFVASLFLGVFIGTAFVAATADHFGRRKVFVGALLCYAAASFGMSVQSDAHAILLFRTLAGVGLGAELVTIDAYVAEFVPASIRGRCFAFVQALQYTAIPILAVLAWLLVPRAPFGVAGWRWILWIGCIGAIVVWYLRLRLPESPRWLIHKGRLPEADTIISRIEAQIEKSTGRKLCSPEDKRSQSASIDRQVSQGELWRPPYRRRVILLFFFNIFQSIGYYGFANWIPTLLAGQGVTFANSFLYSAIIALASPLGPLLGMMVADRVERKWLISSSAMSIAVFGILFAQQRSPVLLVLFGLLIALFSNVMTFSYRAYQAELFSGRVRARAIGLVYSASRLSAMFSGFLMSFTLYHAGIGGAFGVICGTILVAATIIARFGIKTNGQTLEHLSP